MNQNIKDMDTLDLELRKVENYHLKPFGKFTIRWKTPKTDIPHVIGVGELNIKHDTSMPISASDDKLIIKFMIKNKTDILTDGWSYYTRVASGFTEVYHKKFDQYKNDEAFRNIIDNR